MRASLGFLVPVPLQLQKRPSESFKIEKQKIEKIAREVDRAVRNNSGGFLTQKPSSHEVIIEVQVVVSVHPLLLASCKVQHTHKTMRLLAWCCAVAWVGGTRDQSF